MTNIDWIHVVSMVLAGLILFGIMILSIYFWLEGKDQ